MAQGDHVILEIAGREVRLSNPDKVYFPKPGWTKRNLVDYYLAVADAALVHLRDRRPDAYPGLVAVPGLA